MTAKLYRTEIFDKEHIYSGGIIYLSDFNTDYRRKDAKGGSALAARIAADLNRVRNREQTQMKKINA